MIMGINSYLTHNITIYVYLKSYLPLCLKQEKSRDKIHLNKK